MTPSHFVIHYPDGTFQGHSRPGPAGKPRHPKVSTVDIARVYTTETAARNSVAHKGGVVKPVAVVLLEP